MTLQDKAKDIFVKHLEIIPDYVIADNKIASGIAKLHAMISIDEIIKELESTATNYDIEDLPIKYWQEVKEEIQKL